MYTMELFAPVSSSLPLSKTHIHIKSSGIWVHDDVSWHRQRKLETNAYYSSIQIRHTIQVNCVHRYVQQRLDYPTHYGTKTNVG